MRVGRMAKETAYFDRLNGLYPFDTVEQGSHLLKRHVAVDEHSKQTRHCTRQNIHTLNL